jgi:hypothetical protein
METTRKLKLIGVLLVSFFMSGTSMFVVNVFADDSANTTFGSLFKASPNGKYVTLGCTQKGFPYDGNSPSYFTPTKDSISITTNKQDCQTMNTHDTCNFKLGDNGIIRIGFEFNVSGSCHTVGGDAVWLAFWVYSNPWKNTTEVDFVESQFGPASGGLNSNFAGVGNQVSIFDKNDKNSWKGSITADFSGTGNSVKATVRNSVNSKIATSTLEREDGYFFVLDTAATNGVTPNACKITISNLYVDGTVPAGSCIGMPSPQ